MLPWPELEKHGKIKRTRLDYLYKTAKVQKIECCYLQQTEFASIYFLKKRVKSSLEKVIQVNSVMFFMLGACICI